MQNLKDILTGQCGLPSRGSTASGSGKDSVPHEAPADDATAPAGDAAPADDAAPAGDAASAVGSGSPADTMETVPMAADWPPNPHIPKTSLKRWTTPGPRKVTGCIVFPPCLRLFVFYWQEWPHQNAGENLAVGEAFQLSWKFS